MNTVYCPVIEGQIDGATCMEIVDVADGMISERILKDYNPPIQWNDNQCKKCLKCKWHADFDN